MIKSIKFKNNVNTSCGRLWTLQRLQFSVKSAPIDQDDNADEISSETEETGGKSVKFNKSGLLPQHRNMLLEQMPYNEANSWIHTTERYQRKLFGKYGAKSGVNPRICFDTIDDAIKKQNFEKVAYPFSLSEIMIKVKEDLDQKRKIIQKREEEIENKLLKLEQWKSELNAKIAKKEADVLEAKERKERLIEEVRRHFGFKLDPRDDRFKEMLLQKEKEDKKKQKEAKRKAKEDKMLAKLVEKTSA